VTQDAIQAAVSHLIALIARGPDEAGLSPGDCAELRRMDPQGTFPPVMWRLLTAKAVAGGVTALGGERQRAERAVASLVQAMLEAGGSPDTNYAEQRFILLLQARGARDVAAQARTVVRWCATKGVRIRFADSDRERGFAGFILAAALDWPGANSRAHSMARDYFAGSKPQDDAETPDGE